MNSPLHISRSEFESILTRQRLASLSIISIALMMGIVTFAVVAFAIPAHAQNANKNGTDILLLLTGVHAFIAMTIYTVVPIIVRQLLSIGKIQTSATDVPLAEKIFGALQSAHIIRMAMYEGAAMFGLVICLLTSLWGYTTTDPEFLLNGASALIFLLMAAATFPTRDRLMNIFSELFGRGV